MSTPCRGLGRQSEVLGRAAPASPQHSDAVRIVHDQRGLESAAELHQLRQAGHVPFHAENAVGYDQLDRRLADFVQRGLQGGHVVVGKYLADRLAGQATRIDDAGVVQFVRQDDIPLLDEIGQQALVGVPAADVREGGFRAQEFGDPFLQLPMANKRPADESHAGRASAIPAQALVPRLDDLGMVGQS